MSRVYSIVLLMLACAPYILPLKLPDYIKPCKADASLDSCALKQGDAVIRRLIHGDPRYRIPDLEPLTITKLVVNQGNNQVGLNITLRNSRIHGLSKAKFVSSRMNLKTMHAEWDFLVPRLELVGGYRASGQILILPISGNGLGNITLLNMNITYKFDYKIEKIKGQDHLKITSTKLDFDTSRMFVHLENLFNGDRLLGEALHRFLDENWREVVKELGPAVGDAIGSVFKLIFTNIASVVPYKDLFSN
ncbi:protein takeout-like [Homalodisca vitripennis]|nr:protein takeout-like [Homalodisca vitripennis]KAG8316141.1 hypothetical protein J6590_058109 [Homalodisca vitripennis]